MNTTKSEIARILNIDENCTDRELVEAVKRLSEENEMLNMAFQHSVDSFSIADGKGVFLLVNDAFIESTGTKGEKVIGRCTADLVKEGRYGPDSSIMLAIKEKARVAILQGGAKREAMSISNPIFDEDGNIKYVVTSARFFDEHKLLNQYIGMRGNEDETELSCKDHSKMIWKSTRMQEILGLVKIIAPTDSSIMLTGETGTGKSVLARYIHESSNRKDGKFVEINCAAIPDSLIESELFGYEGGAFTGANSKGKIGLIGLADGGTLFLDEIGDMPLNLQAKLLQTLQNRTVTRVGGDKAVDVDIRLITATNRDLEKMVEEGTFRSELYYRINVVPIHLPALRERCEDISIIISTALERYNSEYNKDVILSNGARAALEQYRWPGNIRELENTIERLVVTNRSGVIVEEDLPIEVYALETDTAKDIRINSIVPLKEALEQVEKQLVSIAYTKDNSSYKVAEMLGISQSAASRKIIKYVKNAGNGDKHGNQQGETVSD